MVIGGDSPLCKKCVATIWAIFGENKATFFPSSVHTACQTLSSLSLCVSSSSHKWSIFSTLFRSSAKTDLNAASSV